MSFYLNLNEKIRKFLLKAVIEENNDAIKHIQEGMKNLNQIGLINANEINEEAIKTKLCDSVINDSDDIIYFIEAIKHFSLAGLDITLAEIVNYEAFLLEGYDMPRNLLSLAAFHNSIKYLSIFVTIKGINIAGFLSNFVLIESPLSIASSAEAQEILFDAGGGIEVMLFNKPTCDLTNKVIFGYIQETDNKFVPISRHIPGFEKAITNRYELAQAIQSGRLSNETVENLKEMCTKLLKDRKQESVIYFSMVSIVETFSEKIRTIGRLAGKSVRPSIGNMNINDLEDIILLLQEVKPTTTLKNIVLNSIVKNHHHFFNINSLSKLPADLLETIPSQEIMRRITSVRLKVE